MRVVRRRSRRLAQPIRLGSSARIQSHEPVAGGWSRALELAREHGPLVRGVRRTNRPQTRARQDTRTSQVRVCAFAADSASVEEALLEVLVDVALNDPEGATNAHCGELTAVQQTVDRHLGNPHGGGNFGDREELRFREITVRHCAPLSVRHAPGFPTDDPRPAQVRIGSRVTHGEGVTQNLSDRSRRVDLNHPEIHGFRGRDRVRAAETLPASSHGSPGPARSPDRSPRSSPARRGAGRR